MKFMKFIKRDDIYPTHWVPIVLHVQSKIVPPSEESLGRILRCIERLQRADSPLEKLEHLLAAISAIFNSVSSTF